MGTQLGTDTHTGMERISMSYCDLRSADSRSTPVLDALKKRATIRDESMELLGPTLLLPLLMMSCEIQLHNRDTIYERIIYVRVARVAERGGVVLTRPTNCCGHPAQSSSDRRSSESAGNRRKGGRFVSWPRTIQWLMSRPCQVNQ